MTAASGRKQKFIAFLLICVIAASLAFSGCSLPNSNENRTLAADEEGVLTETIVEDMAADDTFTEDDLNYYVKQQIMAYQGSEDGGVTLETCDIRDHAVKIVLKYKSAEDFAGFNKTTCFLGTIKDAEKAGYSFDRPLKDSFGNAADTGELSSRSSEWQVLIVSEPMYVRLYDKILYSSDSVTITGRLTATVGTDKQNTPAQTGADRFSTDTVEDAYIIYK
ncbi:MAG: hypothetical protein U0L49_00025 [Eubacterium sp.]|nr:hypothetical protein [Eubacterium sp.]